MQKDLQIKIQEKLGTGAKVEVLIYNAKDSIGDAFLSVSVVAKKTY